MKSEGSSSEMHYGSFLLKKQPSAYHASPMTLRQFIRNSGIMTTSGIARLNPFEISHILVVK